MKYLSFFFLILATLDLTSCKKALTENVHSLLTPDNFYKTEADAESGLNGVFAPMTSQTYYQRTIYIISDLSCDEFQPNNNSSDRVELYRGAYTANNGQLYAWWANCYNLIKNANEFVANVKKVPLTPAKNNDFTGNALFLRSLAYFELTTMFGDVPLVLSSASSANLFPARTSADSVYAQVISDLKYAEQNCLHTDQISADKVGRVSSEAASALLARVYLQRASTSFADQNDNQNALAECNLVIAYASAHPANLTLQANYGSIFQTDKKNGPECIFSVEFETLHQDNITNLMFDPGSLGGFASFLPLASFYNSFDAADLRKSYNVGIVDNGTTYFSKYHDPNVQAGSYGIMNWVVLRYADILLMQSEAINALTPSDASKFDGINLVRARAGLGGKLLGFSNTPSQGDFVDALVNERLWELCVEGHRRPDLIRLKKFQSIKAAQGFTIDENHLLLPIPQPELDVNPNLTQNPGY